MSAAEEQTEAQGVVVIQPDTFKVVAPEPVVVGEVDRLRAENLNLKLLNIVGRETIVQRQLADIHTERSEIQRQMAVLRSDIEAHYNIDLNTHHIRPGDGLVIPRNPGPGVPGLGRLQEMVQKAQG